jgi:hypothetical protein
MITVHLMGGLGNQMFQLFAAAAHARDQGAQLVLSPFVQGGRPMYWNSLFTSFKKLVAQDPVALRFLTSFPLYKEPVFHYSPLPPMTSNLALHGYFQSPLYFQEHFQAIAEELRLGQQREEVRQRFLPALQGESHDSLQGGSLSPHDSLQGVVHGAEGAKRKNADNEPLQTGAESGTDAAKPAPLLAALHIRIGDYVRYPAHHPILPVGYYEAALRKLQLNGGVGRVVIFSEADDRARVEAEYVEPLRRAFPEVCYQHVSDWGVMSDGEEMLLMSCCPAIIMANSSFSWWAAWIASRLSEKPVPVYYPGTWFGEALRLNRHNQGNDTRDMFPAEWHSTLL